MPVFAGESHGPAAVGLLGFRGLLSRCECGLAGLLLLDLLLQPLLGESVNAEGGEHLPDDGVRLHLSGLQGIHVRAHLFVDELSNGVAHR